MFVLFDIYFFDDFIVFIVICDDEVNVFLMGNGEVIVFVGIFDEGSNDNVCFVGVKVWCMGQSYVVFGFFVIFDCVDIG